MQLARSPESPCPSRKSYPGITMVQPGQDWHGYDSPGSLDGSTQGSVLAQSQMRARLVVVNGIRREDPPQMLFAKRSVHDPDSRSAASRSGAPRTRSARAISAISADPECPSPAAGS